MNMTRARILWRSIHLYLGLLAGTIFVLVGLSGSILAFRAEIDDLLNKDLMTITPPPRGARAQLPLDALIAAARAAAPEGGIAWFIHFPKTPQTPLDVVFSSSTARSGHEGHGGRVYQVFVNPFDGAVIGQRLIVDDANHLAEPFILFMIHLHYTLLQGESGAIFVGVVGLTLLLSFASGLYLWWPCNGAWAQAFSIKRGASRERFVFDLHRATGAWLWAIFVVMIFTGVYFIFTPQMRALIGTFSPVDAHMIPEDLKSEPAQGRVPIGAGTAVAAVEKLFPDGVLMSLALPAPDGVYVVGKRAPDEVNKVEPRRLAAVDQYSGRILAVQDPHAFTAGERVVEWLYPLHTGEALGDIGRAFICALGLAPALLYATGVTRWLQKRRRKTPPTHSAKILRAK